jgi:hypothetical protein
MGRPKMSDDVFWSRVNIPFDATKEECWLWTGRINTQGYGTYTVHLAHRYCYSLYFDSVLYKPELKLLHKCDNTLCVNPHHLFIGSQKDNMIDCHRKGRHPTVKVSKSDAEEIKRLWNIGEHNQYCLAKMFNCSQTNISQIVLGKTHTW